MAKCVNKVILIGYLAEKPDIRLNLKGKPIAEIKLLTSYKWTDKKTGKDVVAADLHHLILFNRDAVKARDFLKRGSKIFIEGKIKTPSKESDYSSTRVSVIHVSEMQMLDPPPVKKSNLSALEVLL